MLVTLNIFSLSYRKLIIKLLAVLKRWVLRENLTCEFKKLITLAHYTSYLRSIKGLIISLEDW